MRKLTSESIFQMKLFQEITRVSCVDCFSIASSLIFITKKGTTGRAIGPQGKNIKILRNKFKKNIKVFEESANSVGLITNYLYPVKPKKCEEINKDSRQIIEIEFSSSRERRFLLDNQQKGLKDLKEVLSRYHPNIKDIRIL